MDGRNSQQKLAKDTSGMERCQQENEEGKD
jgi:hypothetical protein